MGSGVSVPTSVADALAKGFSQEEIDAYVVAQKDEKHVPLPDPAASAGASAGAGSSNFILKSTKHVTVETGELDKADQRFATGKWCLPKDFAVLSKLRAYRLKVSLKNDLTVELAARCSPLSAGDSQRIALFLHGLGDDRSLYLWSKFWPDLVEQGFFIMALELPGYGRSSGATFVSKYWSEQDADLLLRVLDTLSGPAEKKLQGRVTVFAEGLGSAAFLRAYAQDASPFGPHHVIMNTVIGQIPANLQKNMEDKCADLSFYMCERFYKNQPNNPLGNMAIILEWAFNPNEICGRLVLPTIYIEPDAGCCSPIKSMREGSFWPGRLVKCSGISRNKKNQVLIYRPTEACVEEVMKYINGPKRPPRKLAFVPPQKSMLETGKINENFLVFVRVRPLLAREEKLGARNCFTITDVENFPRKPPPQRIVVNQLEPKGTAPASAAGYVSAGGSFVFDRVFDESFSQTNVYAASASHLVRDFLSGTSITIFAYGQTGTGKTHTMQGPSTDPGIITRTVEDIYKRLSLPGQQRTLHLQYVQLYNGVLSDLLDPETSKEVKLVTGGGAMTGALALSPKSAPEFLAAVAKGAESRTTAGTAMNDTSSRSHAIMLVTLSEADGKKGPTLFMVDLAGSERVSRSGVSGKAFEEATNINQSLSALGRVVTALLEKKGKGFIPYNASALTLLLNEGLGGNSKTCLIACVTQAEDSMSESLNTLRFAMQASHVVNKVASNAKKEEQKAAAEAVAAKGHSLEIGDDHKATVHLPGCDQDIVLYADVSAGPEAPWVVLVHDENIPTSMTKTKKGGKKGKKGKKKIPDNIYPAIAFCDHVGPVLTASGFRWVAPCFPKDTSYKFESLKAEDPTSGPMIIQDLMDYIGIHKASVVGVNCGAILSSVFTIRFPDRVNRLVLSINQKVELLVDTGMEPGELTFRFWNILDGGHPDSKLMKKLLKRKKRNFVFTNCATSNAKFHDKQHKGWLSKFGINLSKCVIGDKKPFTDTFGFKEEDYARAFVKVMGKSKPK